jgi:hypothetical protein
MAKIRRSKTNTTFFLDIPKIEEMKDEKKIKRKYKKIFLNNSQKDL